MNKIPETHVLNVLKAVRVQFLERNGESMHDMLGNFSLAIGMCKFTDTGLP